MGCPRHSLTFCLLLQVVLDQREIHGSKNLAALLVDSVRGIWHGIDLLVDVHRSLATSEELLLRRFGCPTDESGVSSP